MGVDPGETISDTSNMGMSAELGIQVAVDQVCRRVFIELWNSIQFVSCELEYRDTAYILSSSGDSNC
jgi:hypothetical protein